MYLRIDDSWPTLLVPLQEGSFLYYSLAGTVNESEGFLASLCEYAPLSPSHVSDCLMISVLVSSRQCCFSLTRTKTNTSFFPGFSFW